MEVQQHRHGGLPVAYRRDQLADPARGGHPGGVAERDPVRPVGDHPVDDPRYPLRGDVPLVRAAEAGRHDHLGAGTGTVEQVTLRATTDQGRVLSRASLAFDSGADTARLKLDLPSELRNQLSRLEIEELPGAGCVQLLDERWRRRPVGLVSGGAVETRQPLLGDLFYLERALTPYAELRHGTISEILERETAVMVHGGMGYAKEYHVERLLREALIPRIAPVSPELILCFIAEKALGLPKSY